MRVRVFVDRCTQASNMQSYADAHLWRWHTHILVWLPPCANDAQKPHPVTRAPSIPTWTESGQRAGGTTAGVCQCCVPPTSWKHRNQQTNRPMGRHTEYHTQTPPARIHTHVEMVSGHTSAGHSHAQTSSTSRKSRHWTHFTGTWMR